MKRVSLSLTLLVLLIGSVVSGCNGGSDDNGGGNGYVPPPAAEFQVNSLQVTPDEVPTGNTATIKANVTNIGNASGMYAGDLTVNGDIVKTFEISLNPGETAKLSFALNAGALGTQIIVLGGNTCTLEVFSTEIGLTIQSPLVNERFVSGEVIEFRVIVDSYLPLDASQLQWNSSIDGNIGNGPALQLNQLSAGIHEIEVKGYEESASIQIRVFNDLWALYQSPPSQAEIDRIMADFDIIQVDGEGEGEQWDAYAPWLFDQESTDPAIIVAIAKLDVLRHQRFSEPLPFTGGLTAYDHLKTYVDTIYLRLDCEYAHGGGGAINMNRSFSIWDGRMSGSADNLDACKTPFATLSLYPYIHPLYLVMHECRHSEPDEPGHIFCEGGLASDQQLENGSGYAQSALYTMWVYKYGLYDPDIIKEQAKEIAIMVLNGRICDAPTHSNPLVQAMIEELLQ